LTNPDKVSNLILYASGCGGKNATPTNPKIIQVVTNGSTSYQQRIEKNQYPSEFNRAVITFLEDNHENR